MHNSITFVFAAIVLNTGEGEDRVRKDGRLRAPTPSENSETKRGGAGAFARRSCCGSRPDEGVMRAGKE